jgi:hypothetical protein
VIRGIGVAVSFSSYLPAGLYVRTVNEGGQAIVGTVSPTAGGVVHDRKSEGQPGASPAGLAHNAATGTVVPPLRSTDAERERVQVASHGERAL